jgi:hypothetical protein
MTLILVDNNNIELINLSTTRPNVSSKKYNLVIFQYLKKLLIGRECIMYDGYNCKCKKCMQIDLKNIIKNIIRKKNKAKILPIYEIINGNLIIDEYVFITKY